MATTYYKYAERDAANQINWSTVAASVTQTLDEEAKLREEKKADIEKASREIATKLESQQLSESDKLNSWWLSFTGDAQQSMLMADNLLKSGKIKPNDYVKLRQNITDGTDQTVSLFEEYSKEYEEKMKRFNNGDSEAYEAWEMENIEGFSNFTGTKLYINPMDFTVSVAKTKEENGVKTIDTEAGFESMGTLRNRLKTKYDKYDVIAGLQVGVDAMGENIEAIREIGSRYKLGSVTQITDQTRRKSMTKSDEYAIDLYEKSEETFINSILNSEVSARSILTDYVGVNPETGKPYDFTTNATVAQNDPNFILMTVNDSGKRVPNFSTTNGQKQLEVARKALKVQFRMMLDRKEEIQTVAEPSPTPRTLTAAEIEYAMYKDNPDTYTAFMKAKKALDGGGTEETAPVKLQYTEATVGLTEDRLQDKVNKFIGKGATDEEEAANFDLAVKTMVENLPPELQSLVTSTVQDSFADANAEGGRKESPDAYVTITSDILPGGFVNVPAATNAAGISSTEGQNAQKAIIQKIYDAIQTGKPLTGQEVKDIFSPELWRDYNAIEGGPNIWTPAVGIGAGLDWD
jgi:23S rRNA maturation mini-RNase III